MTTPSVLRRVVVAVVVATAAVTGCSSGNGADPLGAGRSAAGNTDAASAKTCDQLVQRAAQVTKQIVADLQGKSVADLTAASPGDPFGPLQRPFLAFQTRADQLKCDTGELRRLACTAYQGIEANGPVAEEFLSRVNDVCR